MSAGANTCFAEPFLPAGADQLHPIVQIRSLQHSFVPTDAEAVLHRSRPIQFPHCLRSLRYSRAYRSSQHKNAGGLAHRRHAGPVTDIFYRGFDNSFPDYYRYTEFARDFDANYAKGGLPALTLVRLMHDHTGNFNTALNGLNTPELQQADNDYAVGLLVQKIAQSQYASNTLIFVIEDDSQDGGDHVDAHRSIAFIVGPYVKQHEVVSEAYNTVDFVRTMEDILGLRPLNVSDALAVPMADVFDLHQTTWTYTATASAMLAGTGLPLPAAVAKLKPLKSTHDAAYWAAATKGMDFSAEDRFNFSQYNHVLWKGLVGNKPYPEKPTGLDLRNNRAELLRHYYASQERKLQSDAETAPSNSETGGGGL